MLCRLDCYLLVKAFVIRKHVTNFKHIPILNKGFGVFHEVSFFKAILIDPLKIFFCLHALPFGDALVYSVFKRGPTGYASI